MRAVLLIILLIWDFLLFLHQTFVKYYDFNHAVFLGQPQMASNIKPVTLSWYLGNCKYESALIV